MPNAEAIKNWPNYTCQIINVKVQNTSQVLNYADGADD
jgi:hypothetical protein